MMVMLLTATETYKNKKSVRKVQNRGKDLRLIAKVSLFVVLLILLSSVLSTDDGGACLNSALRSSGKNHGHKIWKRKNDGNGQHLDALLVETVTMSFIKYNLKMYRRLLLLFFGCFFCDT